jgi:hypothetical protein
MLGDYGVLRFNVRVLDYKIASDAARGLLRRFHGGLVRWHLFRAESNRARYRAPMRGFSTVLDFLILGVALSGLKPRIGAVGRGNGGAGKAPQPFDKPSRVRRDPAGSHRLGIPQTKDNGQWTYGQRLG